MIIRLFCKTEIYILLFGRKLDEFIKTIGANRVYSKISNKIKSKKTTQHIEN